MPRPGDMVTLTNYTHKTYDEKGKIQLQMGVSVQKGYVNHFVLLGSSKATESAIAAFDTERALKRLGYVPVADEWAPEAIERVAKAMYENDPTGVVLYNELTEYAGRAATWEGLSEEERKRLIDVVTVALKAL